MKAKIYNKRWWLTCCDSELLKTVLQTDLVLSGFTVLNFIEHHFKPQGYTALWLLAESHAAVHTFPEEGKSYIELSSCAESLLADFDRYLHDAAVRHHWQVTDS